MRLFERWGRSLSGLGQATANVVNGFYAALGQPGKLLQDFLNGTWLRHPLHATLTDATVGGFTALLVLDLVSLIFGADVRFAAMIVLGFTILAALATIITGLTDFKDTEGTERNVATLHGYTNIIATLVYIVAFFIRLGGAVVAGEILAIVGFLILSFGSYVGGDVVFRHGYMVSHHAFMGSKRAKEFTAVLPVASLPEATPTKAVLGSTALVLVRRGDVVWALNEVCSHAGGPLSDGSLEGDGIVCPWHASRFRLSDGAVEHGPAFVEQPAYRARINGEQVEVQGPVR
jgi:nitrite reductase/ring-hydroxylating ferredoxin subunit/uncharacterized membrane protein